MKKNQYQYIHIIISDNSLAKIIEEKQKHKMTQKAK